MRNLEPKLSDFGIPNGFDFVNFDEKMIKQDKQINAFRSAYIMLLASPALYWLILKTNEGEFLEGIIPLVLSLYFYHHLNFKSFAENIFKKYIAQLIPSDPEVAAYANGVMRYRRALYDWEYLNLETGEGFWKALRGEDFENALAKLFERRNISVAKTKKTGDGGVDLILSFGSRQIFVQCKGHAKPVAVAPVREIAGVCSRSQARPVVAAVNGFTKGARDCARELSVTLIDTQTIIRLAKSESIDWNNL